MTPLEAVDNWNSNMKVGQRVTYWHPNGAFIDTRTRHPAGIDSGTAVIWIEGEGRCVPLYRVLMQ